MYVPELWSDDCSQKRVKVEVKSAFESGDTSEYEWNEIPTAQVHLHQTRDGKADMANNCKVVFPTEWGESSENVNNNVREYVDPLGDEGPLTMGRVLFKTDEETEEGEDPNWVLKHLGFVAGIGQVNELESKCWIYDFATMLESVPITQTYKFDPTLKQVVEDIAETINDETPIPMTGVVIEAGGREYDYEKTPQAFQDGVEDWNDFFDLDLVPQIAILEDMGISFNSFELSAETPESAANILQSFVLNDDALPVLKGKKFGENRDTIVDVLEWVSDVSGASWQFKPNPNGTGVVLVLSLLPTRNRFVQDSVLSGVRDGSVTTPLIADDTLFDTVHVLENTALEQMNPYNTVQVRGAKTVLQQPDDLQLTGPAEGFEDDIAELFGEKESSVLAYPYAKVRHTPLYQAAGNTELSKRVESDVVEVNQAVGEAKRNLRKLLNTPDEGSIMIDGQPFVSPYDRIDAFEVCNEFVETQAIPVTYEVHNVTHRQMYGKMYKSEIEASLYGGDEVIEVVTSQMQELNS